MSVLTAEAQARSTHRYQLDPGVGRLTPAERAARGKAARAEVPRDSHAMFDPPPDRPDPIALLEEQGKSRVPELVPVRYGRMMVSPFTFFRGAALPMASDLAATPVSGLAVQACGDAHLSNFGLFGSAERRLMFDVNDFDETLPGPWEWDVKRLAASLEVAGARQRVLRQAAPRDRRGRGRPLPAGDAQLRRDDQPGGLVRAYGHGPDAGAVRRAAAGHSSARSVDKGLAKARTRDSMQEVAKLTRVVDGRPRIIADPPLLVPIADLLPEQTDRAAMRGAAHRPDRQVPAHAGNRPAVPARAVPSSPTWPARSSASAASGPVAGSC